MGKKNYSFAGKPLTLVDVELHGFKLCAGGLTTGTGDELDFEVVFVWTKLREEVHELLGALLTGEGISALKEVERLAERKLREEG